MFVAHFCNLSDATVHRTWTLKKKKTTCAHTHKCTHVQTAYSGQQAVHTATKDMYPSSSCLCVSFWLKGLSFFLQERLQWQGCVCFTLTLAPAQHITLLSWPRHMAPGTHLQPSLTAACYHRLKVTRVGNESQRILLQYMCKISGFWPS